MFTVEQRVINVISEQLGIDKEKITKDSHLMDDLDADSLDIVETIMSLEEEFDLLIQNEIAEQIRTVGDFIEWLEQNQNSS